MEKEVNHHFSDNTSVATNIRAVMQTLEVTADIGNMVRLFATQFGVMDSAGVLTDAIRETAAHYPPREEKFDNFLNVFVGKAVESIKGRLEMRKPKTFMDLKEINYPKVMNESVGM